MNKGQANGVSDYVASGIQIEARATTDLARVQGWLSRHRGARIELDAHTLELGAPVTGARAVLIAVTVQSGASSSPALGGVVRVLASPRRDEPALLVFEGRSPAHLSEEDARTVAVGVLDAISGMAARDELIAEVA